jgi:hypothetical protein
VDELAVLREEFEGELGTFLARLRADLTWDKESFTRLERAMRRVCEQSEGWEELPRWLVEGFWCCADWVPAWTAHPDFPRPEPRSYYDKAVERFRDLQHWLVTGQSIYQPSHVWEEL